MKYLQLLGLMATLISLFGCEAFGRTVKVGEQFTLKLNQSATVKGTGIEIILDQIGKLADPNPAAGRSLEFSLRVRYNGHTDIYSTSLTNEFKVGKYKIELIRIDPAGEGSATFVNENPAAHNQTDEAAAKFVEQFGWHLDDSVQPVKIPMEFPGNFNGLPFNLYQAASQNSCVDMTPLLGKKLEMFKYTLIEKQHDHQTDFTVYAHLIILDGKVAGAWRTDSSARAPGIYSFVKR